MIRKLILFSIFLISVLTPVNAIFNLTEIEYIGLYDKIPDYDGANDYYYQNTGNGGIVELGNYLYFTYTSDDYNVTENYYYLTSYIYKVNKNDFADVTVKQFKNISYVVLTNSSSDIIAFGYDVKKDLYDSYHSAGVVGNLTIYKLNSDLNIVGSNYYNTTTNKTPSPESWFYNDGYIYYQSGEIGYYYAGLVKFNITTMQIEKFTTVPTASGYYSQPRGAEYKDGYGYFWVGQYTSGIRKVLLSNMSIVSTYLIPPFSVGSGGYLSGFRGAILDNFIYLSQSYNTNKIKKVNLSDFSDNSLIETEYYFFTDYEYFYNVTYSGGYVFANKFYPDNGTIIETINTTLLSSKYGSLNYNYEIFDDEYLYLFLTDYRNDDVILKIQYRETALPTTYSISGNIQFKDIDDSLTDLNNSLIYYNSSIFTYSDSNGNFQINNIDNSLTLTLTISYNYATNTQSCIVDMNNSICDKTLSYSKPLMGLPTISGNYFLSNYSHNFKTMELWENPSLVWGNYIYNNYSLNVSCVNSVDVMFSCNYVFDKSYDFKIIYTDMYNYDLNSFHPFLTGSRLFETNSIYIREGTEGYEKIIVKVSDYEKTEDKENFIKGYLPDFTFYTLILIIVAVFLTYGKRK